MVHSVAWSSFVRCIFPDLSLAIPVFRSLSVTETIFRHSVPKIPSPGRKEACIASLLFSLSQRTDHEEAFACCSAGDLFPSRHECLGAVETALAADDVWPD